MTDAVYLARNGQQLGPYTAEQLAAMAASGEIQPGDMAWHSGMSDWAGAETVLRGLGIGVNAASPPPIVAESRAPAGGANLAAGLGVRWLASILDGLLLGVVGAVVGAVWGGVLGAAGHGRHPFAALGLFPLLYLIQFGYFTLTQGGQHMASLGKRAMKMIVVNRDGQRIGYGSAFVRYLVLLITSFLFPLLLVVLFTRRRQGLHDLLLGTVVIERDSYTPQQWDYEHIQKSPRGGGALLVLAIGTFVFVFIGGVLAAIAIPAYQDFVLRAQVDQALALAAPVETRVASRLAGGAASLQYSDVGLDGPESLAQGAGLLTMDPQGTLTLTLGMPQLRGQSIVLTPTLNGGRVSWRCSSSEVKPRYLPMRCR